MSYDLKSFAPSNPEQLPHLVRDAEAVSQATGDLTSAPRLLAVPLLLGKAHAIVSEIAGSPCSLSAYADLDEILQNIASYCGFDWDDVVTIASDVIVLHAKPFKEALGTPHYPTLMIGRLHSLINGIHVEPHSIEAHSRALNALWEITELNGLDWEDVCSLGEDRLERFGNFMDLKIYTPTAD